MRLLFTILGLLVLPGLAYVGSIATLGAVIGGFVGLAAGLVTALLWVEVCWWSKHSKSFLRGLA